MTLSPAAVTGTGGGEEKVRELVEMHDLKTSVSIGDYYLKQQTLLAVRALLAQTGRDEGLGADWNPDNPYWRQAEQALLERVMTQVDAEFTDLAWLKPLWIRLDESEFSDEEIDALLAHFRSEAGRKQLQIVDHTVSTHVMTTLSFSGKLRGVPGVERERARMQQLWNDEDRNMRFSVEGTMNVDAQRFALSPLGKKYFVTAVLKLTGIVNRRIDDIAARLPGDVEANVQRVRPIVREYKNARG
ncbi:MAG TPA: hypothetical protein VFB20_01725 [Burkholderiales bacterium]|nr:hypothetical protein [Burkholderiales bacterium]